MPDDELRIFLNLREGVQPDPAEIGTNAYLPVEAELVDEHIESGWGVQELREAAQRNSPRSFPEALREIDGSLTIIESLAASLGQRAVLDAYGLSEGFYNIALPKKKRRD